MIGAGPDTAHTLTREECRERLATAHLGRLVVTTPSGRPLVRPVNCAFDPGTRSIVFRTSPGAKFSALLRDTAGVFEVDDYDPGTGAGWSVIVTGVIEPVTRPHDLARLAALDLGPGWAGERPFCFRIRTRTLSGRRIGPPAAS